MELINFVFDDGERGARGVRAVMIDGEPWFVAADVCAALHLPDTHKAVARLDDDEKGRNSIPTLGGDQEMTVVNEPGLYSLVLGSRKPEAKRFKRWVTHEVLPSIRRTGAYVGAGAPAPAVGAGAATGFLSHAADVTVAADRMFRSLVRTARTAGMPTGAAIRRANALTRERTGVDLLAELEHEPPPDKPAEPAERDGWTPAQRDALAFAEDWVGQRLGAPGAPLPVAPSQSSHVYRAYVLWCMQTGRMPLAVTSFIRALRARRGWLAGRPCRTWRSVCDASHTTRRLVVPSDEDMARAAQASPTSVQPKLLRSAFTDPAQWRAAGVVAFESALMRWEVSGPELDAVIEA